MLENISLRKGEQEFKYHVETGKWWEKAIVGNSWIREENAIKWTEKVNIIN